jgi:hypothetical protein
MSTILTTDGLAHIVELGNGDLPTNPFDGLVFSTGNVTPTTADTILSVAPRLDFVLKLVDGYPKQNDTDARNGGKGVGAWTWRFERNAGAPFVASNVAVTNYSGGALVLVPPAPLLMHADQIIAQRFDERLVVWVNAYAGEGSIFTATEDALEGRVQRVVGFAARNRAMSAAPNGSVVSSTEVHTKPTPGQQVWTAADVVGIAGQQLQPQDVVDFTLKVERLQASSGQWIQVGSSDDLDCYGTVSAAYQYSDSRWNQAGGFNVAHSWTPTRGTNEGTFRLRYHMELCDDDVRDWTNLVEVRS